MRPQALRRLAADIGALHSEPLPPNYLFDPGHEDQDDLSQLDILLAGPKHTPFAAGVWRLHLSMPDEYPQQPPTANFRTTIFHPNVHPETGGVCVETLKRDWDSKLTLRDVLVTISCLLIQPNPDSALNAEAGALIQESYDMFARRAELMTSIHAAIPPLLSYAVTEAQRRGHEEDQPMQDIYAPVRQRRPIARPKRTVRTTLSAQSPTDGALQRRQQVTHTQTAAQDDVFQTPPKSISDDEDNQENHSSELSNTPLMTSSTSTPRRPFGPPIPLGELHFNPSDEELEHEYPPSPKKSPSKSPAKRSLFYNDSTSNAQQRQTPSFFTETDTSIHPLTSFDTPAFRLQPVPQPVFEQQVESTLGSLTDNDIAIVHDNHLWDACGRDVDRWNRCDFTGEPLSMIATRW